MRVKDAIKQLEQMPEDDEIIFAFYGMEFFEDIEDSFVYHDEDAPMTKDEWNIFVKVVERWMGWEHTYESITNMALMYWDEYIRPQE
tara:strand:+ start:79 stop:339 length:261 start_codon:yes stop_codon:yes gene_type:complete